MREDLKTGIVTGAGAVRDRASLSREYGEEKADLILFLREMERTTRHKSTPPAGPKREDLFAEGLVD